MLRVIGLVICLGFLISCSSQPTKEQTSCGCSAEGGCSKNLNKLVTPEAIKEAPTTAPAATEVQAPVEPAADKPAKKKSKKKKKGATLKEDNEVKADDIIFTENVYKTLKKWVRLQ